jgi:DNA-binding transcriptional LysR family regulator
VLTCQIRGLEQELKVRLFDRSTRGTTLTAAGESVLTEAKAMLRRASAFQRQARQAARGGTELTVGFMPGIRPTATVKALRERFPELTVEVVRTSWDDQVEAVLDGRIDASFVRLPIERRGLTVVPLFTEPRVVALPASHPLTARAGVRIGDLAPYELLQDPQAVPEWRAAGGARPTARTVEEKLEMVAGERGIVILPESTAHFYTRPDVVHRPISDIGPDQVTLAYDASRESAVLGALAELAVQQYKQLSAGPADRSAGDVPCGKRGSATAGATAARAAAADAP